MSLIPYDNDDLFDVFNPFSDSFGARKVFPKNPIRIDILDCDSCFKVFADIPAGASKEDVKLEFDKGYLTLNVSVTDKHKCDSKNYCSNCRVVVKERVSSAQFSRRMFIAEGLDRDNIKACFNNSVLKIVIPKLKNQNGTKFINID